MPPACTELTVDFLLGCSVCHAALMAYRPYPSVDRARRQLLRGYSTEPPSVEELLAATQAGAVGQVPGRYVLSTRHPGAVSGPS